MNLKRRWLSINRNIIDYGLSVTLIKLSKRLIAPIYENYTYRIYCTDLQLNRPSAVESHQKFVLNLANPSDIDIIRQVEQMAEWLQGEVQTKLKDSHLCVVALDGKKLAGFNLISLKYAHIPLIKLNWKLAADEAWSEQITVDQNYRRRGLGTVLRYKAFNELRIRGIKKFCGGALISNVKSLKLAQRVGYTFTEDVQYIKFLRHKKWYRREVTQ